ncbi:aminotransferase class V-fold PLP-dependent enzyme [Desulfosarcina sp.]|uniref:aminotransferase class V-fold PLP-dependent enzyme n=1 Tax=Desulfosarcina sp. TaxID=2027861 RepID=UPI0029A84401|nr:aminotransferase class V-fold PLP-dependent enzyme [Desulfosarcina sp.]MDX2455241.1 aminotransferase class V-fold PLP-dependent enzyme [Desulfosarcina sp.]MDX2492776.1 aminotransferase class V-fold PLP-dependent enzyme [Desulfosarcina sp.]
MNLDIDFIRSQYPVFANPDTARWAMFENAGGSYVPRQVIDRLHEFFQFTKVQPYGPFEASIKAGEAMEAGYRAMAGLLNCDPDELTLGPSTTMNFYVLAQAIRPLLEPGDEIIVTNQDHEANIGCWRRLAEFGAVIREWQIDPQTGELAIEDLKSLVGKRTRLVCFTLCSNIVGTMHDFNAICDIAHDAGALAIGDGVSFAPHRVLDVNKSGLDLYLFSTYKTFGTHLGVMWGKPSVLDTLEPQGHYFNRDLPHYKFNPAGPLHAQIGALAGIEEYIDTLYDHHFDDAAPGFHAQAARVFDLFSEHETVQANRVLAAIRAIPGARIIGQDPAVEGSRAATIAFTLDGMRCSDVVKRLVEKHIAVRNGHFYALRCIEALGIQDTDEGIIRISLVHYNTEEEVSRLVKGLESL